MIVSRAAVDREFWRGRHDAPRAFTFIISGGGRSLIAPHDAAPDEIMKALQQAARHQMEGARQ